METEHDLLIGHPLPILLVDEDEVVCVLGALQSKVNLVEDERVVVIEVSVAALVDQPRLHSHQRGPDLEWSSKECNTSTEHI